MHNMENFYGMPMGEDGEINIFFLQAKLSFLYVVWYCILPILGGYLDQIPPHGNDETFPALHDSPI